MKSNNSPYEPQRLKKISPPIKIGKTKQVLGKTVFEKNKGGGDKYKDTNQVLKKLSWGYTWRKKYSFFQ